MQTNYFFFSMHAMFIIATNAHAIKKKKIQYTVTVSWLGFLNCLKCLGFGFVLGCSLQSLIYMILLWPFPVQPTFSTISMKTIETKPKTGHFRQFKCPGKRRRMITQYIYITYICCSVYILTSLKRLFKHQRNGISRKSLTEQSSAIKTNTQGRIVQTMHLPLCHWPCSVSIRLSLGTHVAANTTCFITIMQFGLLLEINPWHWQSMRMCLRCFDTASAAKVGKKY